MVRAGAGDSDERDFRMRGGWALALVGLLVVVQGCALFAQPYPAPPEPLRPTMAGVITDVTAIPNGNRFTLQDGTKVDDLQGGTFRFLGGGCNKGGLLLAGTAGGGFAVLLCPSTSTDGCWEAWQDPADPIAWDMGDSVLFMNGAEIPKAPGYHVDPTPHPVDGRLAWTDPTNGSIVQWMSFCANAKGHIEWGQKNVP